MGDQGALLTSSNRDSWAIQSAVFPQVVFDIVWAGSQLVVVGRDGSIFTSPTGQKWMAMKYVPGSVSDRLVWFSVGNRWQEGDHHNMPNMEKPEEFNAIVLNFLERQ